MDELTKKKFDSILLKDVSALTQSDCIFLRARRDYLTDEQMNKYREALDPLMHVGTETVTEHVDTVLKERKQQMFQDFTYRDLQAKLKELGYKKIVGLKREVMIKMIEDSYVL